MRKKKNAKKRGSEEEKKTKRRTQHIPGAQRDAQAQQARHAQRQEDNLGK